MMDVSTKQAAFDVAKVNALPIVSAATASSSAVTANDVLTYLNIVLAAIGIGYAAYKWYALWSWRRRTGTDNSPPTTIGGHE
jgi:hypothetical protein